MAATEIEFDAWYDSIVQPAFSAGKSARSLDGLRRWFRKLFDERGAVSGENAETTFVLEQVSIARAAVEMVLADLRSTRAAVPTVKVDELDGAVRITVDGGYHTPSMTAWPFDVAEAITEVADYLQAEVSRSAVWPECRVHRFGLHAEVQSDRAVWRCRPGDHTVAAIGALL